MSDYNLAGVSPISKKSGAAIAQYAAVMLDSTEGQVVVTSGITSNCIGFAMLEATAAGKMVPIQAAGEAKAIASAAIALGAEVMCDANGKVTTAAGATAKSVGYALNAAGADGDIITIRVQLSAKGPANT